MSLAEKIPLYSIEMTALDKVLRKCASESNILPPVQKIKTKNGYAIAHLGHKYLSPDDVFIISLSDLNKGGVVKFRRKITAEDLTGEMSGFFDLGKESGQKDTFIRIQRSGKVEFDMSDGEAFKVHGSLSQDTGELPKTKAEAIKFFNFIKEMRNKFAKALEKEVTE